MGYVEENLLPDERIMYKTSLHWKIYIPAGVFGFLFLLSLVGGKDAAPVSSLFLMITLILTLIAYLRIKTSEFAITNKRVMIKIGVLSRKTIELLLKKIETVGVDQGILDRLISSGTITIVGTGGTKENFKGISDPLVFRKNVHALLVD